MSIAKDVATAIVKSELWPGANANTVLMLCYLAEAEGNHPAVVYRDYHIMQGKPAKKAEAILRDFISGGGKIKWHALDDEAADATFSHSSGEARITWTLDRAKQAGVGGNAMWRKYPRQMLRSRCISEGVRTVYPGATSGLYEEGEVADFVVEGPTDETKPKEDTKPNSKKGENWGGRYPTKTALWQASRSHHAELERLAQESTLDDLDMFLTSPEYRDYIATALEHAPFLLEGDLPEGIPEEFTQTFQYEQIARDRIALRGNQALEQEPA